MIHKVGHVTPIIRPGGGPSGYLYNLYSASRDSLERDFDVVPAKIIEQRVAYADSVRFKQAAKVLRRLPAPVLNKVIIAYISNIIHRSIARVWSPEYLEKLYGYSALVFHDHYTAFPYFFSGIPQGQKVFVMPHGPADFATETIDGYKLMLGSQADLREAHAWFQRQEMDLYRRSNGILSPTRGALESYFQNDPALQAEFAALLDRKHHSIITGVAPLPFSRTEEYRQKVNPHGRAHVLGYFGRLVDHKGFDVFLDLVRQMQSRTDIQFVCAGSGVMEVPELPNLINLGWISGDMGEYLAATDLLVSPNKYTYFDLLILEALSVGTPVITANVGGSRYFGAHTPGVLLFERGNLAELSAKIGAYLRGPGLDRDVVRQTYQEHFSMERFVQNHQELAHPLLRGN